MLQVIRCLTRNSQGVDVTILAYGQTGSGKTHTVLGEVQYNHTANTLKPQHLLVTAQSGIFLRVMADLFTFKQHSPLAVTINVSILEIYLDNLRDLLSDDESYKVQLRETDNDGIVNILLMHNC